MGTTTFTEFLCTAQAVNSLPQGSKFLTQDPEFRTANRLGNRSEVHDKRKPLDFSDPRQLPDRASTDLKALCNLTLFHDVQSSRPKRTRKQLREDWERGPAPAPYQPIPPASSVARCPLGPVVSGPWALPSAGLHFPVVPGHAPCVRAKRKAGWAEATSPSRVGCRGACRARWQYPRGSVTPRAGFGPS